MVVFLDFSETFTVPVSVVQLLVTSTLEREFRNQVSKFQYLLPIFSKRIKVIFFVVFLVSQCVSCTVLKAEIS